MRACVPACVRACLRVRACVCLCVCNACLSSACLQRELTSRHAHVKDPMCTSGCSISEGRWTGVADRSKRGWCSLPVQHEERS